RAPQESAPPGGDPGVDRSRAAAQPGTAAPPAEAARLHRDAGDDFTRYQGARAGEARRRRRLPAVRRGGGEPRDRAHGARTRCRRIRPRGRPRAAARHRPHRSGPGADARVRARPGALAGRGGLPAAALGHAAVAAKLVEIAGIEQSNRVARGGVSAAPRIAAAIRALTPDFSVLAPATEWGLSRDQLFDYAAKRRLPMPVGGFGTAWPAAPGRPAPGGGEAAVVDITFAAGVPVALIGVSIPLLDLIGSLDFLAGKNGVDGRRLFEPPSVAVLAAAHRELQERAGAADMVDFSRAVSARYSGLIVRGDWFTLLRAALDAYVDRAEQAV